MPLPENFASPPGEELHRYFRNICRDFKKTLQTSLDPEKLETGMDQFIDASKQMNWHRKPSESYRKDEGEKAVERVWNEFKRFRKNIDIDLHSASSLETLEALAEVERLVNNMKAS